MEFQGEWLWRILGLCGSLISVIASFFWWDLRRIGKNLHSLRTDISSMILPLETDIRELQRSNDRITGQMQEAAMWREMVLQLIQQRPPKA